MKITLQDVKNALKDVSFRQKLPTQFKEDIQKYEQNPGCSCNLPIYRKILKEAGTYLLAYYPNKTELSNPDEELLKLAKNNWKVINCHVDELEDKLKKLPVGRKQIAITRYIDQVTVVINELDVII